MFGGEHSAHYYFRDNYRADSGIIATMLVLEQLSQAGAALSTVRKPFERYAASGEINTAVADPLGGDGAGGRGVLVGASRTASTASPSTAAAGGSTSVRPTPSRSCASTSRPDDRGSCDQRVAEVLALITEPDGIAR